MKKVIVFFLLAFIVSGLYNITAYASAKSVNANLKSIKLSTSTCTLSPVFNKNRLQYNIVMPADRSTFTINAKSDNRYARVSIQVKKGSITKKTNRVSLSKGKTATVYITVTAQAGNKKVYTINVSRLYGKWRMYWQDEFNGDTLDAKKWDSTGIQGSSSTIYHYYKPENVSVSGGYLHLTAKKEEYKGMPYTSGWVSTLGKKHFKYGKFVARVKVPSGVGMFPAFWLWQVDRKKIYQELDIMEYTSRYPKRIYSVHHYGMPGKLKKTYNYINTNPYKFHVYTAIWTDKEIRTYIDGKLFYKERKNIPKEEMYLILNLAIGGWAPKPNSKTVFPSSLVIDYVRVYEYY